MESLNDKSDLLACIAPVVHALSDLCQGSAEATTGKQFRTHLLSCFEQYEADCYRQGIAQAQMQEAKFALVAMCDELVMDAMAQWRMEWMICPLQLELFGHNRAGEEFFQRLENLRLAGEGQRPLLEVFFVCLQLGFEGAYKMKGRDALNALVVDLRQQLDDSNEVFEPLLSPQARPQDSRLLVMGDYLPYWVIVSVALASVLFMFMGFDAVLSHKARESRSRIEAQQLLLHQGPLVSAMEMGEERDVTANKP